MIVVYCLFAGGSRKSDEGSDKTRYVECMENSAITDELVVEATEILKELTESQVLCLHT